MQNTTEKLVHGKKLNNKNFPNFVETFNSLVQFFQNLKGDYDLSKENGYISIDRNDDGYPVVRLVKGMAGGGSGTATADEPWEVDIKEYQIKRPVFQMGMDRLNANYTTQTVQSAVESKGSLYCVIDLYKKEAEVKTTRKDNAQYQSFLICEFTEDAETKEKKVQYSNRYPMIPVWQTYSSAT